MSASRRVTVLQLCANRWWTGSADPVIRLVKGLEGRGHRALLALIPGDRFEAKAREAGIEPLIGLSLEARFRPAAMVGDVLRLRRLVRREQVDVVHVHHSHDHWLGLLSRGRAVLVRTFHNQRAVGRPWPSTWLYRQSDALIAVSRQIEEHCRHLALDPARVFRVGGVVDLARFAAGADGKAVRAELGLGTAPVIGSVARLAHDRGHELLILGFQRLLADYPEARLLLVGKGEARPRLEALVRERGLGSRVLFAGYRDADLPAVLRALDVFALMAAGSDESCRAALEAMAAGCPVIARRLGALPEAIVHGSTGLLVDDERPESVAAALRAVVAEPARARAMGEAGRRRAEESFSPARHAADVEAIYLGLLSRRAPSP
ncbi:MAG: glycosyltransferase family 4 protein [Candidatus Rokubacteria bacterium]|nr:glycosyltransferase family 4 protein [Candidatus Rokubacteria bacterium]MBI3105447.1 glycosyltransferase family 4 protein [Candidatus Rokubacteria bacterium]